MHIAVCSKNKEERYELSRLADDQLLLQGILPEISLFPMLEELLIASVNEGTPFELMMIAYEGDPSAIKMLSGRSAVILVGEKQDGPDAFEAGASYFLESPVDRQALAKAFSRCFRENVKTEPFCKVR